MDSMGIFFFKVNEERITKIVCSSKSLPSLSFSKMSVVSPAVYFHPDQCCSERTIEAFQLTDSGWFLQPRYKSILTPLSGVQDRRRKRGESQDNDRLSSGPLELILGDFLYRLLHVFLNYYFEIILDLEKRWKNNERNFYIPHIQIPQMLKLTMFDLIFLSSFHIYVCVFMYTNTHIIVFLSPWE